MSGTRKEVDPLKSLVSPPAEPRPPAPKAPTPAELARILAKAAAAKAGAPTPAAKPKPPAAPVAAPAAAPRAAGLAAAPPPRRTLSAADALEAARRAEEDKVRAAAHADLERARAAAERAALARAKTTAPPPSIQLPPAPPADPTRAPEPPAAGRPAPTPTTPLTDTAQALVAAAFPGVPLYVGGAWYAEDRKVLTALWKAHRSKFAAGFHLDRAAGVATVLTALQAIPARKLVAAHVIADRAEYLVWMDLQNRAVLAAFAEARALFAGLEGA